MPIADTSNWFLWAVLSACFAALTAIFAKIGLEGSALPERALFIQTAGILILAVFSVALIIRTAWQIERPKRLPKPVHFRPLAARSRA